jgi:hypothetical protein
VPESAEQQIAFGMDSFSSSNRSQPFYDLCWSHARK